MRSTLSLEITSTLASTSRRLLALAHPRSEESKTQAIVPWSDESGSGFDLASRLHDAPADDSRPVLEPLRRWFGAFGERVRAARNWVTPRSGEVEKPTLPAPREPRMNLADPAPVARPTFPPEVLDVPCRVRRYGEIRPFQAGTATEAVPHIATDLRDFLWKPASDVDGKLVVVLGPSLQARIASVEVVDPVLGERVAGRCCGTDHGGHTHVRFPRGGATFPLGCQLEVATHDGQIARAQVPAPAFRFEVRER